MNPLKPPPVYMHYDIADQEMLKQEGITIVTLNRHLNRLRNKTVHVQVFGQFEIGEQIYVGRVQFL